MKTDFDIKELDNNFQYEDNFNTRYVNPKKLNEFLNANYKNQLVQVGKSVLNKPIYKLTLGKGKRCAIMWTQMHGNETTGTLSALDLLKFLSSEGNIVHAILSEFTVDIIFMLNPDGSEVWTRRNIEGIDINRDYIAESSIEMHVLKQIISEKNYHLAFNLHDQRTIFGVKGKKEPATLAFLSPSVSEGREITDIRKKSMGIIAHIYRELTCILPDKISRFTDEFYPRSSGDNIQKSGIPTLLFEAGHYPDDYQRKKTRKYFSLALITALYYASTEYKWEDQHEEYLKIPENSISYYDIIYRNVRLSTNSNRVADLGIQYAESIKSGDEEISFSAKIEEIGDLSHFYAHSEYDAEGRSFYSKVSDFPKLGLMADFQLDEWIIVNGKKLDSFV
ncbi:M14 family zinc carboxypeptidase [Apibacter raozihei]|uniref:M14 family zinc carboxypeptidase n=1 Tax=Apibacter raozihei TaxID=2500547 RepID=UPI000FE30E75|nr:M14 family zinc carboxypeptidase [Apibacter raozihei]